MDTEVDWTCVPPCDSCRVVCAASILSSITGICAFKGNGDRNKKKRPCLVFGSRSVWGACESQCGDLVLTFSAEPSFAQRGCITLHDGEPLYQQELLGCVVFSLQTLNSGDALLLPVFSALTRVTAAIVLCLHVCFRSVTFRCPPPSGAVGTMLVCVGFCPEAAAQILPLLTDVHNCMSQLLRGEEGKSQSCGSDRQVLQFVPMEELLTGGLTEFLWTMNSEIIQQKLHLLMQT
ncbi:cap-specific mRNA (nucleoside-2'-O-)-methyltransferase 2-like protein [Lates japonicus]|uniref:Cap-specific mRNA (Nucleoside-2'-O-)-methyltransferase 2-like protein n=1 Tax=Lates japonicus TaxID=270547 RepID=A0AAD3NMZ5_LATJO|nr:cap-specific mRNA (nucleoside-2'-O-)-methyltransferase 2-like protein [Lates japonicus]